jgi:hypothetical protein
MRDSRGVKPMVALEYRDGQYLRRYNQTMNNRAAGEPITVGERYR